MLLLKQLLEEKKKMLPGLLLVLLLGAGGVWALAAGEGFPHYNRYYTLGEYLKEVEQAMAENLPFSRQLSELAVQLKMAGGAKEFDGIFVGDDILIEDIGQPNQRQTEQNIQTLTQFSQSSRIPTYFMLLPTKCAIKQNELPAGVPLFNQKQFIEQTYNHLLGKATVVDVYPALFAKFEEDLYYKTSPSLTALGGYSVYEVLAQRLDNTPKPQEDFDIQYVTHNYYGPTYRRSTYQEISPDVIALYRYQKNNRTYTVTHNEGYSYSYDSLYPQQMMQLGEPTQVLLGGNTGDITIRSNLRNKNTLLIVGDDSILPVLPFLAAHYSEIRFLDPARMTQQQLEQFDCTGYQRILISYSVDSFIHGSSAQKLRFLQTAQSSELVEVSPAQQAER